MLDQPLLRELAQRLPQRSAAGAEPLREMLLDEPLARSERAAQDLVLQPPQRQFDQARRLKRAAQFHGPASWESCSHPLVTLPSAGEPNCRQSTRPAACPVPSEATSI